MSSSEEWLTTLEVAAMLRVHPKHVYRLLRQGLPARRVGGQWRFSADEVLGWAAQGRAVGVTAAEHVDTDAGPHAGARARRHQALRRDAVRRCPRGWTFGRPT